MNREKLEKNIASNLTIDLDVEKFIEVTLLDIEQYANQRVIEELEKLLLDQLYIQGREADYIAVESGDIEAIIKKLKQ